MKRGIALLPLLLGGQLLGAELINGISALVNNSESITLLEVYRTARDAGVNNNRALELLIEKALHAQEIKRLGIKIGDAKLDEEMEAIAQSRGQTLFQLKQSLKERYGTLEGFEKELRDRLERDELFKKIIAQKSTPIDDQEIKEYYRSHKAEFGIPETILATKYFAGERALLERFVANPMHTPKEGIRSEEERIETSRLSSRFAEILATVQEGEFTPILDVEGVYLSFYIQKRENVRELSLENAKNAIHERLILQQREKLLREHFEKLRATAKVTVLRLPPEG